jgi:quercetin dioxygenase-like cupin family protein
MMTEIEPRKPTYKGPEDWFTGDVWIDPIVEPDAESALSVISVHFHPGARTAWHAHAGGQILHVTEGEGLVQSRGGPIETIRAGDLVHTPSQEWHWHGASRQHYMSHLSITHGSYTFGAHVTDVEHDGVEGNPTSDGTSYNP